MTRGKKKEIEVFIGGKPVAVRDFVVQRTIGDSWGTFDLDSAPPMGSKITVTTGTGGTAFTGTITSYTSSSAGKYTVTATSPSVYSPVTSTSSYFPTTAFGSGGSTVYPTGLFSPTGGFTFEDTTRWGWGTPQKVVTALDEALEDCMTQAQINRAKVFHGRRP